MAGRDTLRQRQRDGVNAIRDGANRLAGMDDPSAARAIRDTILENAEQVVRAIEILAREEG